MREDLEVSDSILVRKARKRLATKNMLSTGYDLLNLACSGKTGGAIARGTYILLVGDSGAGKTWLCHTLLAEASINPSFDNYRLIFDNAEDGAMMELEKYFGRKVAQRVEPPKVDKKGNPIFSVTPEDFYYSVDDALKGDKPFIYILDSMDVLEPEDDEKKFQAKKKAHEDGKKEKGSYGTAKAKLNSGYMRGLIAKLRNSRSIVAVVSQSRDVVGNIFAPPGAKTRGGGHALKFYAAFEIWLSVKRHFYQNTANQRVELGIESKVSVKKNRVTGQNRQVLMPIYHSFGIDNTGGCVDWLIERGYWKKKKGGLSAPEFGFIGSREKLIRRIERQGLELELRAVVSEVWQQIEDDCAVVRKKRYQ